MLEVEDLTVAYGDTVAVRDLDLDAVDGEVLGVIGPSGCGKSTLLRTIAGLTPARRGSVRIDGTTLDGLRPDERGVGLMFQDNALFPHRSVGENVAFGPRMHGLDRTEISSRVAASLALVDLAGTEHRPVTELSGGEQQRVALARAIAPRPRLLMLDEPLGSLDRALRDRLLEDLPRVFAELGTTVIYVTHDQTEALALADRIAVMRDGALEQLGSPRELWRAPRSRFVAGFLGLDHTYDAEVTAGVAHTALGAFPVPGRPDGPAALVLLPEALRLASEAAPPAVGELELPTTVTAVRFAGDHTRVDLLTTVGHRLSVQVWRGTAPQVGDPITVAVDTGAIHLVV